jgi:phosphatidylglycerol:prolipoprotein diacylglycerol transferase
MHPLAIPYPNIDPVALNLGPLSIKWYGLAYVCGLLLGWLYIRHLLSTGRLWPRQTPPLSPNYADDIFIWVTLGVVVGGRLGHVLLYEPAHYLKDPLAIFAIWQGGMAFHGGFLGVVIALVVFGYRHKLSPLTLLDLAAAAVPIGLFFGRVANFINGEVVGIITDVPWGIVFPGWGPLPRHPVQLYEAILEGPVLFLILRWLTHKRGALALPGLTGGAFVAGYGALRMICEVFKLDEYRGLFGDIPVTPGLIYCIPMVIAGAILMARALTRPVRA